MVQQPMRLSSLLLFLGCSGGTEDTRAPADTTDTVVTTADTGPCVGVPAVTYANFGEGFILHFCQGCHASTTPNRYDAPEDVTFDSAEQVWEWRERILIRAAVEPPTMPPAGVTTADDRVRLGWWLNCAEDGS